MDNRVLIYEIYPSSPDVPFHLTHSLKVKGTLDNAYMYGNTLACSYHNNLIVVWDFIQNKAIGWEYNHVILTSTEWCQSLARNQSLYLLITYFFTRLYSLPTPSFSLNLGNLPSGTCLAHCICWYRTIWRLCSSCSFPDWKFIHHCQLNPFEFLPLVSGFLQDSQDSLSLDCAA